MNEHFVHLCLTENILYEYRNTRYMCACIFVLTIIFVQRKIIFEFI